MSLLRNFSPGGQPDDEEPTTDEQPTTGEQPTTDEQAAETAPPGGGQPPGTPRYAFAGPAGAGPAGAGPAGGGVAAAPSPVVSSEVVRDEPAGEEEPGDEEEPGPAAAAEVSGPEVPAPSFEPYAPETAAPVMETSAPETAPVPAPETVPVPVPSPRATGLADPAGMPPPDFTAPLLSDMAELRSRWQRVQGDFVDDPQAAVSNAANLVGQTAEALMDAVRQRQRQLRAAWESGAAGGPGAAMAPGAQDTEHLRLMMQRYRALFNELCRPS